MSRKNGNRARADIKRRENLHKKASMRAFRKALQEPASPAHPSKGTSNTLA
jgi:hypothetical protein